MIDNYAWEHISQLGFMAIIIFGSQGITRRVQRERLRVEAGNLRAALIIGCESLREIFEENLCALAGGGAPLMPARHPMSLLRTQLARLTTLEQHEIEAVLTALFAAERADAAMAISGRPAAGAALTTPRKAEEKEALKSAMTQASALLESARMSLSPRDSQGNAVHANRARHDVAADVRA